MESYSTPRILTVGVFDYFHYGHLRLFKQIKEYFPHSYLIVAVQQSESIKRYKPDTEIFYPTQIRCEIISDLRLVDEVVIYTAVDEIIEVVKPDIFAVGEDQNHAGFQRALDWCKKNDRQIVRLHRTPDISSTQIKQNLEFRRPSE